MNLEGRTLKVFGKGAKERIVPFGVHVKKALTKYLDWRGGEANEPLFLSRIGKPLKPRSVQSWLVRDKAKAGISGVRVSPHTLLHSFAVQFLKNGGDAFTLQRILGHSDPKVSVLYARMAQDVIQEVHGKASPADNLASG